MFCPNCGKELPENSKFCSACGSSTEGSAQPESTLSTEPVYTPQAAPQAAPQQQPHSQAAQSGASQVTAPQAVLNTGLDLNSILVLVVIVAAALGLIAFFLPLFSVSFIQISFFQMLTGVSFVGSSALPGSIGSIVWILPPLAALLVRLLVKNNPTAVKLVPFIMGIFMLLLIFYFSSFWGSIMAVVQTGMSSTGLSSDTLSSGIPNLFSLAFGAYIYCLSGIALIAAPVVQFVKKTEE